MTDKFKYTSLPKPITLDPGEYLIRTPINADGSHDLGNAEFMKTSHFSCFGEQFDFLETHDKKSIGIYHNGNLIHEIKK